MEWIDRLEACTKVRAENASTEDWSVVRQEEAALWILLKDLRNTSATDRLTQLALDGAISKVSGLLGEVQDQDRRLENRARENREDRDKIIIILNGSHLPEKAALLALLN